MLAKLSYYLNMGEVKDGEEGIKYRHVVTGAVAGVILGLLKLGKACGI